MRATEFGLALLAAAACMLPGAAASAQEERMAAPIVFFDIAGPDQAAQTEFYSSVFGWDIGADGSVTVEIASPVQGTLRTEAENDSLLYFGVPDITATLEQIAAHGGSIDVPRFEVPGVVILGLFRDPAGNRMGLVEIDESGRAIVP